MTTKNKKTAKKVEEKATEAPPATATVQATAKESCSVPGCPGHGACRVFTLQDKEQKEMMPLCLTHFNEFNKKATAALVAGRKWWLKDYLKEAKP